MAVHKKHVIIRSVDMQIMLDILKKTPQLTELKKLITSQKQINQHSSINDKYFSDAHKLSTAVRKTRNAFLIKIKLTRDEIEEITH